MKKYLIILFVTAISTTAGNFYGDQLTGNVVYAATETKNVSELDNKSTTALQVAKDREKLKTEIVNEVAKITEQILSSPTTNVENFKVEFAEATARVTAKVMIIVPTGQKNEFANEMSLLKTKIIMDQNLDIQEAKAEFSSTVGPLTQKTITNADIGISNIIGTPGYISPETYAGLINELNHVVKPVDKKVKFDGEIRYHYAANGNNRNISGIRTDLAFVAAAHRDWLAYANLESKKNIANYDNEFTLSRIYVKGKVGKTIVTAGSFGYLMAEGNIYDSGFKGAKFDFGQDIKYTLSFGETNDTTKTYVASARYNDFDYNVEAGVYNYQVNDTLRKNTIIVLSGNYNYSNIGIGTMILRSALKDTQGNNMGYVLNFNYGELKTWMPGSYGAFIKYYNQSAGTYIAHGMNGTTSSLQGFKGYAVGINYALKENLVAGIEYYSLKDKISGEKNNTWWNQVSYYF